MSSKREEERNEKIIRGLMKLPPNRRCINCNSLGPQYVCTDFWTFVCTTCSGIHREFTHRVKSVSMAKFTSQEVDALQKGGNQRAREIYLSTWDPERNRLPNNSNIDKVRQFIKSVYVDKIHTVEKSSDRPPRDPQSLRSDEDQTRRASSYHSYSQSPPYDFQYEERRYGKRAPTLTRPGSDRGLYDGNLASFLSPACLSARANDDGFSNEVFFPRVSDYSVSGGNPYSETSRDISNEAPQHPTVHNADAISRSNAGRTLHPQRTSSLRSFGSFTSMSFKSVNSLGLPEVGSIREQSAEVPGDITSFSSVQKSSIPKTFDDSNPTPFAPENVSPIPLTGGNLELSQSAVSHSVNLAQQYPISAATTFTKQQISENQQPSLNLLPILPQQQLSSSNIGEVSDVVVPNTRGWATFDMPQNVVPMSTESSTFSVVSSSDGDKVGNFNPFSIDQISSYPDFTGYGPFSVMHTFGHQIQRSVEATNNTQLWSAFEDSSRVQPTEEVLQSGGLAAVHGVSYADKSVGLREYEASKTHSHVKSAEMSEPPSSGLSSNFSLDTNDFSIISSSAGVYSSTNGHKPTNPFDLPYDAGVESSSMFWDMSSLQAALPNAQTPTSYVGGVDHSWFPQSSIPSFVPGEVPLPARSLGFVAGQAPSNQIQNIHAQGPVASVGGLREFKFPCRNQSRHDKSCCHLLSPYFSGCNSYKKQDAECLVFL